MAERRHTRTIAYTAHHNSDMKALSFPHHPSTFCHGLAEAAHYSACGTCEHHIDPSDADTAVFERWVLPSFDGLLQLASGTLSLCPSPPSSAISRRYARQLADD